jgi:6-phosphogluconolactonase
MESRSPMNFLSKIFISFMLIWTFSINASGKCFVYVSLRSSNAVKILELNKANGSLSLIDSLSVSGGPAAITLHPSKKYLYIAQREAKTISTFFVNRNTGKLTCLNTIKVIENPVYLSCDKTGKYLFTAYYAAGKIGVYHLNRHGGLDPNPVQVDSGFKTPHCIIIDTKNKFVFVADKDGDKIAQYIFDPSTGRLTPNQPFYLITTSGTGPRHLIFNNAGNIGYFINEIGNTVTAYSLNDVTGLLTAKQTEETLPDAFKLGSKTADIHLTPNNKFLYASNRGHNSIAVYSINKTNGELNLLGNYPTEKNPRSFAIDPTGKFLIVAGESSDWISVHKINKSTGMLNLLYSQPVGKQPSWVMIVGFNNK